MDTGILDSYLQQIKGEIATFRKDRVTWAYIDLLNSVNFANELIDDVKDEDIFELAANKETKKTTICREILQQASYFA